MSTILGLRGTGNFTADERPQNWREMLLYLYPNGEAPLTALLSKIRNSQPTDDPSFNWWQKRLPTQRQSINNVGGYLATDLTLTVTSGAKDCVAGSILLVERTGELLRVDADPSIDTSLHVVRGYGSPAAALLNGDFMTIIGNVHEEGADVPTSRSYSPTRSNNFTQIFRTSLSLTRTAKKTRLRWDNQGPYREARREALSLHSIEMEKAFIWGSALETTGPTGMPERMTGGVLSFITTNKGGSFNVAGLLDESTLDDLMESVFRYGSNEKLVLCGSTFIKAITTLGKRNGTLNVVPQDRTYGMKIVEYITAFGTLMLKNHPLFSQHPVWRQNALVLDVGSNLTYRYIDDTMFIRNRQAPGVDASKDEFLTEAGLELHFEETHAYIEGVTGALIA